jgi:hypothetical protein
MLRTLRPAALAVLLAGLGFGCGRGEVPTTSDFYDFTGTVTVQGKPADRVSMNLTPVDPTKGREDVCLVSQGKYDLKKVMAGKYKVSFMSAGGTPIPRQYQAPATSGFELDASNKGGEQNFDLK